MGDSPVALDMVGVTGSSPVLPTILPPNVINGSGLSDIFHPPTNFPVFLSKLPYISNSRKEMGVEGYFGLFAFPVESPVDLSTYLVYPP